MTFRSLLILPAALACLAAAPATAQKASATKAPAAKAPATKAPAAKAPAAKAAPAAAAAAGPFDATNPQGIMDLLGAAGAKVQTSRKEADAVFVTVTSPAASFSMQFAGCNPQ